MTISCIDYFRACRRLSKSAIILRRRHDYFTHATLFDDAATLIV